MPASIRWLLLCLLCLLPLCMPAQENRVVRVGVAVMQNKAGGQRVSGEMQRDRLVSVLNQEKPDKKLHLKVQGVPLKGATRDEADDEAVQEKCDYVVYTSLVELQASNAATAGNDPTMPPRPGTIPTYPGGIGSAPIGGGRGLNAEYSATVDYRLYRTGVSNAMGGSARSNRHAGDEESAVAQAMSQIANSVYGEIKKVPPPPQR